MTGRSAKYAGEKKRGCSPSSLEEGRENISATLQKQRMEQRRTELSATPPSEPAKPARSCRLFRAHRFVSAFDLNRALNASIASVKDRSTFENALTLEGLLPLGLLTSLGEEGLEFLSGRLCKGGREEADACATVARASAMEGNKRQRQLILTSFAPHALHTRSHRIYRRREMYAP